MTLYPSLTSQQAWNMVGVTPLIGINDDPSEIFSLANAQQLTTFAQQNGIGELSMWELPRDLTGHVGLSRCRRRQRNCTNPVRVLEDLRADRKRIAKLICIRKMKRHAVPPAYDSGMFAAKVPTNRLRGPERYPGPR